jgi:hypothetical protein
MQESKRSPSYGLANEPTREFGYSDEQWGLVKQALKRIGIDADSATVVWNNSNELEPYRRDLRSSLEALVESYLKSRQYIVSMKSREKLLKPVRVTVKRLLEVLNDPRVRTLIAFDADDEMEVDRIKDSCINGDAIKIALDWDYQNLINELHFLDMRCVEACGQKFQKYLPEVGQRAEHPSRA